MATPEEILRVRLPEPTLPELDTGPFDRASREAARMTAADIEQAILDGENRIEVVDGLDRINLYLVPEWRKAPIKRARVEYARWRHRRVLAGTRSWFAR